MKAEVRYDLEVFDAILDKIMAAQADMLQGAKELSELLTLMRTIKDKEKTE